jgi:hypothetical protein
MTISYDISATGYLERARTCLDIGSRESLFHAAFELRSGTESRLQDYLDARDDIAKHRKQGWKIVGSAKELDRVFRLGNRIVEARFLDEQGDLKFAVYYIPINSRLRDAAGGRLHDLLHAMTKSVPDDDPWWSGTRAFLEQIYEDLAFVCQGTLLAPIIMSPDGNKLDMRISFTKNSPLKDRMPTFGVGALARIGFNYLDELPDYASPFLDSVGRR